MSATQTIIKPDEFRHSFSSVGKFINNPSAWLCHYALGLRSPSTPAMVRGNVSEFGAYYKLKRASQIKSDKLCSKLLKWKFDRNKFVDGKGELQNSIAIADVFTKFLQDRQLTRVVSYQKEISQTIQGLSYPVRAFTDFEFDNIIVDAKSTMRMPSAPKVDHIRQQALYSKLYNKPTALLYATPKKTMYYQLEQNDIEDGYNQMLSYFKSLENYIKRCNNSLEEAIKTTPLYTDPNPFAWDINIKQEAEKIWQKVNN